MNRAPEEGAAETTGVRVTHERVLADAQISAGLQLGATVSTVEPVGEQSGSGELVHVIDRTGVSMEYNPARVEIGKGRWLELQGLGVDAGKNPDGLPDVRLAGVAVTGELPNPDGGKRLSYTVEAKLTLRSVMRMLGLGVREAVAFLARVATRGTLLGTVADLLCMGIRLVSPVIGIIVTGSDLLRLYKTLRDPTADKVAKAFAAGVVASDLLFLVNPIVGTAGSAAVAGIAVARGMRERRRLQSSALPPVAKESLERLSLERRGLG